MTTETPTQETSTGSGGPVTRFFRVVRNVGLTLIALMVLDLWTSDRITFQCKVKRFDTTTQETLYYNTTTFSRLLMLVRFGRTDFRSFYRGGSYVSTFNGSDGAVFWHDIDKVTGRYGFWNAVKDGVPQRIYEGTCTRAN